VGCDPIIGPPPMEHGARRNVEFEHRKRIEEFPVFSLGDQISVRD
jgi:hypothetical protein